MHTPTSSTATREDLRRAAGRLITCGFPGKEIGAELREILREVKPAGLIVFGHNIESPSQLSELCYAIKKERSQEPVPICIDQEGGRVARVRSPATVWPPMRVLGDIDDVKLTKRVGQALGRELRAMNIDVDFAPILDVDTNPANPIIGDRAFSRDAAVVGRHGAAFIAGLAQAHVGACGKHFPGHGDTDLDSHLALPRVRHELSRLRRIEWPPFKEAIAGGLDAIMTAHVIVESLDPDVPATLSPKVMQHLRKELSFDGLIISDDLEMKAVFDHFSIAEMAKRGIAAGIDMFLVCHDPKAVFELYRALVRLFESDPSCHQAVLASEKRVVAWRDRHTQAPHAPQAQLSVVGCAEHAALADELLQRHQQLV